MNRLEKHKKVAWDFDGTLFENPSSDTFAEFIRTNPFKQEFYIVTFRSHGMVDWIAPDLMTLGLHPRMFAGIETIPNILYANYERAASKGGQADDPAISRYIHWKGETCKRIGATILIDDMPHLVKMGCGRHEIEFVHPNELGFWD